MSDIEKIDKLAGLLKESLNYKCTCYDEPERPCKWCSIMEKAYVLYEEIAEL